MHSLFFSNPARPTSRDHSLSSKAICSLFVFMVLQIAFPASPFLSSLSALPPGVPPSTSKIWSAAVLPPLSRCTKHLHLSPGTQSQHAPPRLRAWSTKEEFRNRHTDKLCSPKFLQRRTLYNRASPCSTLFVRAALCARRNNF